MKSLKNTLIYWLDPYRQSFWFFHWKTSAVLILFAGAFLLTLAWRSGLVHLLLDNAFVYLPNYLTHEMLGHNLVGGIFYRMLYTNHQAVGRWIATLAGNEVETLVPLTACWFVLRMQGGRWLFPPMLYWLSTTLYGAGIYAQDARACSLPLTSSDMVTNYAPGEICGDWNHILEPLGLLNYDQLFAYTFLFFGSLFFMLAVYSAYYYWTHPNFYADKDSLTPTQLIEDNSLDNWQPPNIYNPRPPQATGDREYPPNGHADRENYGSRPRLRAGNRDFPSQTASPSDPNFWRNDPDGH